MSNRITRSTVNEDQYTAPKIPSSGFALSYRRYSSYALGRIHVAGYHWVMPGDKISGKTSGKCTFERITTPIVSPVNAMQYNIFIPLRPLDTTFKKGITPTKLNAMSANWSMPMINTRQIVRHLFALYANEPVNLDANLNNYYQNLTAIIRDSFGLNRNIQTVLGSNWQTILYGTSSTPAGYIGNVIQNLTTNGSDFTLRADSLYLRDALLDVAERIKAHFGDFDNPLAGTMESRTFLTLYLTDLLEPFVGRYSYYGELKYEFLRPWDFYRIANGYYNTSSLNNFVQWLNSTFSDTPQNEYKIRGIYAIWYERFRNIDLEPVSTSLPDWQEFGSTSVVASNPLYLLWRIRPWEDDMFISAQIDDMSRHVYAPIFSDSGNAVAGHNNRFNNHDTNPDTDAIHFDSDGLTGSKPSIYTLSWLDSDGNGKSVQCPVPSNINDILAETDQQFVDVYGLDLNTLRQSQMLEKYLKRNYLFGDEYQDRMLAHYNSRVSDMRINKPEILSQSLDGYDMKQEIANMSNGISSAGDRTAIADVTVNGEQYTSFAEEFGIMYSIVCFMPRSMYDGSDPLNYMGKQNHLPIPEFATNNEEFGRKLEIAGTGLSNSYGNDDQDPHLIFGRYPAYHAWRSRVDEVGGKFLDEMQDCTFRRFFGMFSDDTTPKLNYFFIHCRPNLQMFASPLLYDMQLYGDLVHECFVERVLPTPVEVI